MKLRLKEYINLFSKYLKSQKLSVILLVLVLAVSIGLQLINPQITRYFIDAAKEGALAKNLTIAAIMYIGVAIVRQVFNIIFTYLGENIAWKVTNDLRIDLIEHCINLDMSFHKAHKPGELIERVDGDVSQLFGLFSNIILNIISNFLLLVGILLVLLREDWRISLGLTLFSIIAMYFLWYVKSKTQDYWVKASEINAEFYGFLGEHISSTEDIASSGAKNYVMNKFYKIIRKMFPIIKKANLTWASMWSATLIIFAVGNIIAFTLSSYLYKKGLISVGTVYLIFNYTELLRRPIEEIRVNLQELQVSGASIIRVKELFDIKSKMKDGTSNTSLSKPLSVKFNKVDFEYEKGVKVLQNISLNVKSGRVLGILGHTGSGKTTLARLLVRLYDVNSGEILLNEKNIADISSEELSKNIDYVTQNVQLFSSTVRDNITLFNNDIKDEIILNIIENLGLGEWYDNIPNGLDTIIETGGGNLSAGEAQLLAFVRVFLRNPGLIILDEATSRIDPVTEQLIESALNKLLKNRTCIIIAHRLCTLERADDILVLENGNIVECGEREELLNNDESKYYNLLQHNIEEVLV
ncbi:ABC transporter ATP-binding protein [Haloimpatiens sp. FM7330]|uniref:ABC transporter ATP-binding protein n=1 Tax=Haloimpatiens sp. FM7330 TaxID=3298610 RepID=UPI003631313C